MKIQIIAMCNLMGRPIRVGEVIETQSQAEEKAAGYLISIGKAKDVTPVISVDAVEAELEEPATEEDVSTTSDLTPDPPLQGASQSPKRRGEKA